MTTQQRKALQTVVLEAGEFMLPDRSRDAELYWMPYTFSCNALEYAFDHGSDSRPLTSAYQRSHAYWHDLFGGAFDESVNSRTGLEDSEARQLRLLMLALTHTLIGTGDFETITGYSP